MSGALCSPSPRTRNRFDLISNMLFQLQARCFPPSVRVRVPFEWVRVRCVFAPSQGRPLRKEVLKAPPATVTGCSVRSCVCVRFPATRRHAAAHQGCHMSQPLSSGLVTHGRTRSDSRSHTAQNLDRSNRVFFDAHRSTWIEGFVLCWLIAPRSNREAKRGKEKMKVGGGIHIPPSVSLLGH